MQKIPFPAHIKDSGFNELPGPLAMESNMNVTFLIPVTLIKDDYLSSITTSLPLLVLLAFVALGQQSAKSIAIEKETNLKEYMLMMGLSRTTLWTSWYIHFMILSLFPVCIGPFSKYYHFLSRHNSNVGDIWWTTVSPTSLSSIIIF